MHEVNKECQAIFVSIEKSLKKVATKKDLKGLATKADFQALREDIAKIASALLAPGEQKDLNSAVSSPRLHKRAPSNGARV